MTRSGKSVFYFGIYAVVIGLLACIIPEQLISLLQLPEIPIPWARVMGLIVIIIGAYDIISGRNDLKPMIKGTIYMRLFFFIGIMALFISGEMPKEILTLGIIDLLGAVWTILAFKQEAKAI